MIIFKEKKYEIYDVTTLDIMFRSTMESIMKLAMKTDISTYHQEQKFDVTEYLPKEKEQIIAYMKSFPPVGIAGRVYDCVKGERTIEENLFYEVDEYIWSSQDIYNIEKYNAALEDVFYKKIVSLK